MNDTAQLNVPGRNTPADLESQLAFVTALYGPCIFKCSRSDLRAYRFRLYELSLFRFGRFAAAGH